MKSLKPALLAAAALAAGALSSCSTTSTGSGSLADYQAYDLPAKKPSNPSAVKVKVSLSKQRVYVMENGKPLLVMPVSVGAPGSRTPAGNFTIFKKEHMHRANSHGYAYSGKPGGWSFKGTPMPYWCEFKANYGFHTGWVKHSPCTHGCIRMHENLAPKFYNLVKVGTPVSIAQSQPEDSSLANIPLPPDAGPLPDYEPMSMYVGNGYFTRHKAPKYE